MKVKLFCLFLTLILIAVFYLSSTFVPASPQWHFSGGDIARLGQGAIKEIASSPDGTQLAVATSTGTWYTDEELSSFKGHEGQVNSVAFSPDGQTLASGGWSDDIILWDTETGELLQKLTGHTGSVKSIAFSPNGKTLAGGFFDKTVRLWDVETGMFLQTLTKHTDYISSVAFSPDGKTLASASHKTVHLWDVETGAHIQKLWDDFADWTDSVVFSADGKTLASGGRNIYLWEVTTGLQKQRFSVHGSYANSVAFSPDSKMLAIGNDNVHLWDVEMEELVQTFTGHTGDVTSIVFSPDGKTLASGSEDGTIRLWNIETSLHKQMLTGHTDDVYVILLALVIVCLIVVGLVFFELSTRKSRAFLKEHGSQLSSEDPKILLELSEKCDEYLKDRRSAEIRRLSQQAKTKAAKVERKMDFEANLETFKSEISEDGSHPAVVSTLKEHMHNPDSFQHVSSNYETVEEEGKHYCKIVMVFRGANTFGALVLQTCFFVFDEANRVSLVGSPNDAESSSLNTVTLSESIDAALVLFDGVASAADLLSFFGTDE